MFNVGDIVIIKSLDWYNENKDSDGTVNVPHNFVSNMRAYCGQQTEITEIHDSGKHEAGDGFYFHLRCDFGNFFWSSAMFDKVIPKVKYERNLKLKQLNEIR